MAKLAFVGIAGSGKDFLAKYLTDQHEYTRVAFADSVKKYVHDMFPFIKENYEPYEKEQPLNLTISGNYVTLTPREVWINISKPILQVDSHFFLNKTKEEIDSIYGNIIVTDTRRIEEFEYLMESGFTIVLVEPKEQIYSINEFDERINEFKHLIEYKFTNNFDGTKDFEEFLKSHNII